MYVPPHFQQLDLDEIHQVIHDTRIATLVTNGPEGLYAGHLPMMLSLDGPTPNGTLLCHVSRANAQWTHTGKAMAVFVGADAYVSPSFYPTKAETGKVVPTWNYIAVHAHGPLRAIEDPDELLALITRLTNIHEGPRAKPWRVDDAPAEYIQSQLKGIVGLELFIEKFDAKWKLSQNRNSADVSGTIEGLRASEDPLDRATAYAMSSARPAWAR